MLGDDDIGVEVVGCDSEGVVIAALAVVRLRLWESDCGVRFIECCELWAEECCWMCLCWPSTRRY